MNKKILYLDMDGVIVDFLKAVDIWKKAYPELAGVYKDNEDMIHGIFRDSPPITNAITSVFRLHNSGKYDIFIATAAPWNNPESLTDKRYWIEKWFGDIFNRRIITTHRKDLLIGDYLVDDRKKNGAGDFKGELILFGSDEYPDWNSVLNKLL
jgi:5'-nucleotidase